MKSLQDIALSMLDLVSVREGGTVADALANGRLAGAYLDTFVEEPLPQASPLWDMPQVWVSPHNSAASRGHEERVVDAFVRELEAELRTSTQTG